MQRTADFRDHITYAFPKHTDRVLDNPATFHTAIDVFDPCASASQLLIERLLFIRQATAARFLEWCDATHALQSEGQEAEILQELAS